MAKDYAPKYRAKTKSRRKKSVSHLGLWLLTLFLIGAFVFGLIYIRKHRPVFAETTKSAPVKSATKAKPQEGGAPNATAPQFDFYKMLPKEKVTITKHQAEQYWLRIITVPTTDEADKLKATLALNGFDVTIKELTDDDGNKNYQISVGPYGSKNEALADQKRLSELKMTSELEKNK